MRRKHRGRPVNGIVLLDKPPGVTSNAALQRVKALFGARKAGHTGNLDAPACGLLPTCFGEATKVSGFLLDAHKRYQARIRLGVVTTTGDETGDVVEERPVPAFSVADLERIQREFTGAIEQVPPMHSAIKHRGQPLYKLAHRGIVIERQPRKVTIFSLALRAVASTMLEVDVECSKGTYIRTLAEDIGKYLGCGAHVAWLRRTGVASYDVADALGLDELQRLAEEGLERLDQRLLPADSALSHKPDIRLSEDAAYYLCNGQPVMVPHAPTEGLVRLYSKTHKFLGVGQVLDDGRIAPRRLVRL